jgi:hypothetical protein
MQDTILYLREHYTSDIAFRRRADEAVRHVIAAKMRINPKLELSAALRDPAVASETAGTGIEEMRALAEAALTLVQPTTVGELRARLARGPVSPDRVLIVECWADCYPVIARTELQSGCWNLRAGRRRAPAGWRRGDDQLRRTRRVARGAIGPGDRADGARRHRRDVDRVRPRRVQPGVVARIGGGQAVP